ncbi:MAP/microtubule affinity-regulating kinase 3 [Paragonimus heterotremus]|uniref:MAP/microtubule affinity-regulating kinase 3 n=1 Tax=Paragonimus heterotremus TaxID=100268 RepID=A0A8J4TAS5_9TREM|nr:MAP/microtubule affinity-regulating kinase 3 [Paragonimus heterotremus]
MPRVQYIGRPSLSFYGKYLSEIAKNLKTRGVGRVVVKETETAKHTEPCFYVLSHIEPLMSDTSNVRCRAWGRRIFRGRDLGSVRLEGTHEPDWRLLSTTEANALLALTADSKQSAQDEHISCVAPMPPLLALHLRRNGRFPESTLKAVESLPKCDTAETVHEASGFLLLTRMWEDPTSFKVPLTPSSNEQSRIHPPYAIASSDGLVRKRHLDRDFHYIRRSDTPGLYWKVITTKSSVQTEIPIAPSDQNFPSAAPPQETKASES